MNLLVNYASIAVSWRKLANAVIWSIIVHCVLLLKVELIDAFVMNFLYKFLKERLPITGGQFYLDLTLVLRQTAYLSVIYTLMTSIKAYGLTLKLGVLLHFCTAFILAAHRFGLYNNFWSILTTETQVLQ